MIETGAADHLHGLRGAWPPTDAFTGSVACGHGAQTPIALAALVRDGLVLMVHRRPTPRAYPDCWDLVGGHVDSGESPHRAGSRECREELGVDIHDPLPIPMTMSDLTLDAHAFLVTRLGREPVKAAPDEHDIRWFRPRDLADLTVARAASLSSTVSAVQIATD